MSSQSVFQDIQEKSDPLSSSPHHWAEKSGLRLGLLSDEPGVVKIHGMRNTIVSVHVGPSVQVSCRRAGKSHRGTTVHGDIEIIPAGTVHQYLIRRRVECAKRLLCEGRLSISQIALEAGFAHQSHLAHHMRRLLGVSPRTLRETLR